MSDTDKAAPDDDLVVIYRYGRAEALRDGVLVDLTDPANESGFVIPVACTAGVWHRYVAPEACLRPMGQSEKGRTHDVLHMLRMAIARVASGPPMDRLSFDVTFLMPPRRQETVTLQAVCGPGDGGEPVITIMLPGED